MCGICGQIGKPTSIQLAKDMLDSIAHRGPDANGYFIDDSIFFGHTRLSIIDLSEKANQPMNSWDNRYKIIFNGEIYNFLSLKSELMARGVKFSTSSDTEVIINGYSVWGNDIFKRLNGIFALAIWDKLERKTIFTRDRFGVKPLYYYKDQEVFIFGSEIKAILLARPQKNIMNNQALVEFLKFGNNLGEQTIFDGIKEVKPGYIIELYEMNVKEVRFWNILKIKEINTSSKDAIDSTRDLLEKSVKRQLISDVPVGVFLSGGIDSTLITAFASKNYGNKLNTYTAAFDFDNGINELSKARKVSEYFDTNHHEMHIEGKNIPHLIESLIASHDAPFSDAANIPLYLLTKNLNNNPKVILQGDGGDEFFGGYFRHEMIKKYRKPMFEYFFYVFSKMFGLVPNHLIPEFGIRAKRNIDMFANFDDGDLMANISTLDSESRKTSDFLNDRTKQILNQFNPNLEFLNLNDKLHDKDILQKMLFIETQLNLPRKFLEKVDKSTMANSIEVRVPLLDNELTEYLLSLKSNLKLKSVEKKWLLKKSLQGIVPDFVLEGKKTGFGVPYSNWLKSPLKELMMDTFNNRSFINLNIFNHEEILIAANDHISNTKNYGLILWKLMHLGLWVEKYKVDFES